MTPLSLSREQDQKWTIHYLMTVPLNSGWVRGLSTKMYLKFIDATGSNALSTSICGCAGTFFTAEVQEVCLSPLKHNRTSRSLANCIWIWEVSLVPPRVLTLPESIFHVRCFPAAYIVEVHSGNKEGACSWSRSTRKCFHIPASHKTSFP